LCYATTRSAGPSDAVVVASYGHDEEESLRSALDSGVGYVALVASRKRGAAVLDGLGLTDAERARVHTPAGLDIGARTAGEVAVSLLAEFIASRAARAKAVAPAQAAPAQALDPVCGMTVTIGPDTPHLVLDA